MIDSTMLSRAIDPRGRQAERQRFVVLDARVTKGALTRGGWERALDRTMGVDLASHDRISRGQGRRQGFATSLHDFTRRSVHEDFCLLSSNIITTMTGEALFIFLKD